MLMNMLSLASCDFNLGTAQSERGCTSVPGFSCFGSLLFVFRVSIGIGKYRELCEGGLLIRTIVELCVRKESDKVRPVTGRNVITLQMQGNISKCYRIAIDVQSLDYARVPPVFFSFGELAAEVLREVRRS